MTADEFASNLGTGVEEYASDVAMLAYALDLIDKTPRSNTYQRQAELLLASDWLAARDAEQRRLGREEGAGAVLDAVEAESSSRSAGRLDVLRAARAAAQQVSER